MLDGGCSFQAQAQASSLWAYLAAYLLGSTHAVRASATEQGSLSQQARDNRRMALKPRGNAFKTDYRIDSKIANAANQAATPTPIAVVAPTPTAKNLQARN